jgi:hypothetical protein
MKITNKKVDQAIRDLETLFPNNAYDLRDDNVVPHKTSKKYVLYAPVLNGLGKTSTYGAFVEGFNTQNEFIEWVEDMKNRQK